MSITHLGRLDRRRTHRVALSVPLQVRACTDSIDRFNRTARAQSINSHGCSIDLDVEVAMGDVLLLVNKNSGASAEARVASIHRGKDRKVRVGVEFPKENAAFWNMSFPRPGARPLRRLPPFVNDAESS